MTKKKLCAAVQQIITNIWKGYEDPEITNRALFYLHIEMYHRRVKEFDAEKEHCKVFDVTVDIVTFEEVLAIANADK